MYRKIKMWLFAFFAVATLSCFAEKVDVLCIYYPEWHVYPEGDIIFGKGHTEWDFVNSAIPRFAGHEQPIRLKDGNPDDSNPKDVAKEIDYAADAGIDVFVYDWYWANHKPIQHEALERGFLKAPNRKRMKFALMWANHNRSDVFRSAPGKCNDRFFWKLRYDREEFLEAIDYCIREYFGSPQYYRKDGKLFFSIYSAMQLVEGLGGPEAAKAVFAEAQKRVRDAGLPPLHLSAMIHGKEQADVVNAAGFDSTAAYNVTPYDFDDGDIKAVEGEAQQLYSHKEFAELHGPFNRKMAGFSAPPYIPVVARGWDASPRCRIEEPFPWKTLMYPYLGIIRDTSPQWFRRSLEIAKAQALSDPKRPGAVLINAWNEYTEGSYLMPDVQNGDAYLRAVKAVFGARDESDKVAHFDDSLYKSGLPTHRDVAYGDHFRQKLDVWVPSGVGAAERLPCVVVIHGGAWVDGNRVTDSCGMVVRGRRDRLVVVSISYRMVPGCKRAGIVPPLTGPLDDAVSALAFVKAHADEWHIDEKRIGLTGGSAGACSALYAALQGDNALGVRAIQIGIAQTTLDPEEVVAWVPGGWYGGHGFGYGYTDIKSFAANREKWLPWILKYSPAQRLREGTAARAPMIFYSTHALAPYGKPEPQPQHSGYYMIAFSRLCREKGVFCEMGDTDDMIAALKSDLVGDPLDSIRSQIASGARRVAIPRGVYPVEPRDGDRRAYLRLKGLKDVAIDFGGSRFLCREKTRFIDMIACTNVTVRNFTVDYAPLPFTQAIIEKVDADRNWDVRIVPGYPRPSEKELAAGVWPVQAYAREDLELKNPNRYRDGIKVTKTGDDTYRVSGGVDRTGDVGDICVWSIAATGPCLKSVIASEHCTGCRYEDFTAYSTPGGCICAEMYSHGATYRRCRLVRCPVNKDSSPRAMPRVRSGNHDAFNARFGDTVTFDGCEAAYHCDDSINISGYYSVVVKSEGPRLRVFPAFGRGGLFKPGDTIQIMTYDGRVPPDAKLLKVEKAEPPTDDERKRVLATRLREPCLNAVKSALTLTLDRDANLGFGAVVIANERMGNGFAIRNCRFGSTRARAMIIKASDGIIENNFIERSHYDAISLYTEYEWLEGGCARNVTIRGNVVRNSGGGIAIGGRSGDGTKLPPEAHPGIVIENNDIK